MEFVRVQILEVVKLFFLEFEDFEFMEKWFYE